MKIALTTIGSRGDIHHFGFGTTAEVLRAGLPSIPNWKAYYTPSKAPKNYLKKLFTNTNFGFRTLKYQ